MKDQENISPTHDSTPTGVQLAQQKSHLQELNWKTTRQYYCPLFRVRSHRPIHPRTFPFQLGPTQISPNHVFLFLLSLFFAPSHFCQVVEVLHPGKANVSKAALSENLAKSMKVSNAKTIQLFGFRTAFGGGKSTGFGLIYDDVAALMKFEPKYRKIRGGFQEAKAIGGMKIKKENKNKAKKSRGTGAWQAKRRAKKAAAE